MTHRTLLSFPVNGKLWHARPVSSGFPSQGSITVEGDTVLVRFRYSASRFQAIKAVRGARFDKERRLWTLPLDTLPKLTALPEFAAHQVRYDFDTEKIAALLRSRNERVAEAAARIRANPFAVQEDDIALVNPDLVVTLGPHGGLLAKLPPRSKAKRLLEALPQVRFNGRSRAYALPTPLLPGLLRQLRDKHVRFAVHAEAGRRLSGGATLRAQILDGARKPSARDLRASLLVPFISEHDGDSHAFSLHGWTTEQLRELLPGPRSFRERTALAARLRLTQVAQLMLQARNSDLPLWLTEEVRARIAKLGTQLREGTSHELDDALLVLDPPALCWCCDREGAPGLMVADAHVPEISQALGGDIKTATVAQDNRFGSYKFLRWPAMRLLELYEQHAAALTTVRTRGFSRALEKLQQQRALLLDTRRYHEMQECALSLTNHELEATLFPHQRVAVRWLLDRPRSILGDDMGLGKTLSVLAAAQELIARGEITKFLVVCPNSLVRNWVREAQRWTPQLNVLALPSTKRERLRVLRQLPHRDDVHGVVVNYESARLDYVHPPLAELYGAHPALLCLDESQRVKNPQSKSFQALRELAVRFPRRVLLTGTPTPRDLADIWAQMLIVDDGERFGTNFYDWLASVAELGTKYSEHAVKRFLPQQSEEVIARVHEVLLRRAKEQVVDLPEKLFSERDVELRGEQLRRYEQIRDELLIKVRTLDGRSYEKSIESVLEEYLRAVQLASNPRIIDPQWSGEPAKFLELDEIVHEVVEERGEKLVVWTNYLRNVEELVARYQKLGSAPFSGQVSPHERHETVLRFQDPASALRLLVAVPAAGGVGITLTAARTAVYLDRTWNAEHWLQSVDRLHRIGQNGTVNIICLNGCKVDELIARNLQRKQIAQARLLSGTGQPILDTPPSLEELLEALSN